MGYCKRCGEILFSEKCKKCGNTTSTDISSSSGLKTRDVWTNTYVDKEFDVNNSANNIKPNYVGKNNEAARSNTSMGFRRQTTLRNEITSKQEPTTNTASLFENKLLNATKENSPLKRTASVKTSLHDKYSESNNTTASTTKKPIPDIMQRLRSNRMSVINPTSKNTKDSQKSMLPPDVRTKRMSMLPISEDFSKLKLELKNMDKNTQITKTPAPPKKEHTNEELSDILNKDKDTSYRGINLVHESKKKQNETILEQEANNLALRNKDICSKCQMKLEGEYLYSSNGNYYHSDCFVCHECHKPFMDGTYLVYKDKEYHKECAPKTNVVLCSKCNKTVEGRYIKNKEKSFHPECFKCSKCFILINSKIRFGEIKNMTYCENCIFEINNEKRRIQI